ncbi:Hvo_1808 family surface protein [Halorussus salilacus]|uniref:Hvo_1808 family surface protein n=1 Tax=Halorussus salilacus TaxID=2953750 RepID=UPI0020A15715|nr:Hvo_1808 family surface protein [Halorussus salilacus]USZ69520.1 Hvo_1808 family surface protein [Halorussus salilacus]
MRTSLTIAVVLMLVLAGCAQAPGSSTTTETTQPATDEQETDDGSDGDGDSGTDEREIIKPADPEQDALGWEDGYWYNETINVTPEDGLNESELDKVVARSMARVERVRGLEFDERVPVEIQTREEFRAEQGNRSMSPDRRVFDNTKFESLFMIGEDTDSIAVQNSNSGSAIGGFYSPSEEKIVVVSENATTPQLNEITLSQELFHALQDQKYDLTSFNQSTRELHNAKDGVIEGDGNYVDYLYERRCTQEWGGDCLTPQSQPGQGDGLANMGPYLLKFQPYSDGPAFVEEVYEEGGWEAVNALYEDPPESTEQVIHPDKYGEDDPAEFSVPDRSGDGWERMTFDGRPNYASVGEAGIFSMFMYPYYDSEGQTQIVPAQEFFNINESTGELRSFDPLNYESDYSEGWDGDKLVVYTSDTTEQNETGYVWKSVWDSEADAEEFVEGYREVLDYNDATEVDGRENTWRIEGEAFGDAFYVHQDGDTVVVVNAPTVEDLPGVWEDAPAEE